VRALAGTVAGGSLSEEGQRDEVVVGQAENAERREPEDAADRRHLVGSKVQHLQARRGLGEARAVKVANGIGRQVKPFEGREPGKNRSKRHRDDLVPMQINPDEPREQAPEGARAARACAV